MGIGFVLLIWAVVGFVMASLGSLVMMAIAKSLTRYVGLSRHAFVLAAGIFPFVCLGWAGTVFVFQAVVNTVFLHRDPGAGDYWVCPLSNGYALSFVDTMDHGELYDPKTQNDPDAIASQRDTVFGVSLLQISGQYILGGASSETFPSEYSRADRYFLIDGKARTRRDFGNIDELKQAAAQVGVQVNLEPVDQIYSKYRFTWFDVFVAFLFCAPLLVYAGVLLWWLIRLRRNRPVVLQSA